MTHLIMTSTIEENVNSEKKISESNSSEIDSHQIITSTELSEEKVNSEKEISESSISDIDSHQIISSTELGEEKVNSEHKISDLENSQFDIKIDAVFSLAANELDTSGQSSNEVNDLSDGKENAFSVNTTTLQTPSDVSNLRAVKENIRSASPSTKACSVVLKKIKSPETVSDGKRKLDSLDSEHSKARPSRKRKPISWLTSDEYIKSNVEYRTHIHNIALTKRLKHMERCEKEALKNNENKEEKVDRDTTKDIEGNSDIKTKVKKKRKKKMENAVVDSSNSDNVLIQNADSSETTEEIKEKQVTSKDSPNVLSLADLLEKQSKRNVLKKKTFKKQRSDILKKKLTRMLHSRVSRSDESIKNSVNIATEQSTVKSGNISPDINKTVIVQNVSEFPKVPKMKSLLSPGIVKVSDPDSSAQEDISQGEQDLKAFIKPKKERIPCTMTGRCIKPNSKYAGEYLTDFTRNRKEKNEITSIKLECETFENSNSQKYEQTISSSQNLLKEAAGSDVFTSSCLINEQDKVYSVPDLVHNMSASPSLIQGKPYLASLLQDKTSLHIAQKDAGLIPGTSPMPSTIAHAPNTSNKVFLPVFQNVASTPIGQSCSQQESTVIANTSAVQSGKNDNPTMPNFTGLNTKKFFHLQVGDKVVLIPTDGDVVIPKAYVMDVKQSEQFQSRFAGRSNKNPPVKINYKPASSLSSGQTGSSSIVPPSVNRAVSLLANTGARNYTPSSDNLQVQTPYLQQQVSSSLTTPPTADYVTNLTSEHADICSNSAPPVVKIKSEPQDDYEDFNQSTLAPPIVIMKNETEEVDQSSLAPSGVKVKSELEDDFENTDQPASAPTITQSEKVPVGDSVEKEDVSSAVTEDKEKVSEAIQSPPVLTKVETDITYNEDNLNSPPTLTKTVSEMAEVMEPRVTRRSARKGRQLKDMQKSEAEKLKVDVCFESIENETESQMKIRKLKEKLRQKQTEIDNLRKSFGADSK